MKLPVASIIFSHFYNSDRRALNWVSFTVNNDTRDDSGGLRDYNAVQATLFATAIFVTAANLLVDLAYGWLNPRIRYQ